MARAQWLDFCGEHLAFLAFLILILLIIGLD